MPKSIKEYTKCSVLQKLASIYDPLGFISPVHFLGKMIYREICDLHIPWDSDIPKEIKNKWMKWEQNQDTFVKIPRSIPLQKEAVTSVDIHTFDDASSQGVCAAVYAVIRQPNHTTQGLIASKARLAKKNLTIPQLELVSTQMSCNLAANVKNALDNQNLRVICGWTDSTVVLHWLQENDNYQVFVNNRIQKIKGKDYIEWRHLPTNENPTDIGTRGSSIIKLPDLWWKGPSWLAELDHWPEQPIIKPSTESEKEKKMVKEVFTVAVKENNQLDNPLEKFHLWKVLSIFCWINRFINNSRRSKVSDPLTTEEMIKQRKYLIRREQQHFENSEKFINDQQQLNLKMNEEGLYECRGRIQGDYPLYIPSASKLSEKLIEDAHKKTIHGGVTLTMAVIRSEYWIPSLGQLVKKLIRNCYGCKKHHTRHYPEPTKGLLPKDRTKEDLPFRIIGIDYAGPLLYKSKTKKDKKAYILLFTCSLVRAIHLELLPNQTTEEFIRALKGFIARRGRPKVIYSDNAKTFVAASKWISKINKDESGRNFLSQYGIKWKFNLSRAPWWGGQLNVWLD